MKNKPIYYTNGGIKFTILVKNNKYHLDFYKPDGTRIRKSTKKTVTQENLRFIKTQLIPDLLLLMGEEPTINEEKKEYTLDEYATLFFELEKNKISEASWIKDNRWRHIYPYFGKRIITTISKTDLEQWQNNLLNAISPITKKRYKRGYIQNLRSVFNKILTSALHADIIEKNHFLNIPTPRKLKNLAPEQIEQSVEPFTKEEMEKILKRATGQMRNFILFMYATGMRPGEIIALEWDDIDLKREVIYVTKTRSRAKDGKPKTPNSIREVEIYTNALNALNAQYKLTRGREKIFVNEVSKTPFASHTHIAMQFKNILRECNIEGKNLYTLRHTYASTMISIPNIDMLWVSNQLGHKDLDTTLKKYAKFIKQDEEMRLKRKREIDKQIDIL